MKAAVCGKEEQFESAPHRLPLRLSRSSHSPKPPPKRRIFHTFANRRRANRRTKLCYPHTRGAPPRPFRGGAAWGRRQSRLPYSAKPNTARRVGALTALLVGTAAFWRSVKGGGEIESRRVRKRRAVRKRPSSAAAAAFSIFTFPETSAETPHLSHFCKSATC